MTLDQGDVDWGEDIHAAFALLGTEGAANQEEATSSLHEVFERPEPVERREPYLGVRSVLEVVIAAVFLMIMVCLIAELAVRTLILDCRPCRV